MHNVKFDIEACVKCHQCADACFVDVIRWNGKEDIPYAAYPEDCQVCCTCEKICPAKAIEVIPDWKSKYIPQSISTKREEI